MRVANGFNRTVPFQYAGGKKWMAGIIGRYLPSTVKRILIPFYGRGDYQRIIRNMGLEAPALVSDINPWLIATHQGIRENPGQVIGCLKEHLARHSDDYYAGVRNGLSTENSKPQIASDFIYMMNATYKACLKQNKNGDRTNVSAHRSVSCQPASNYAHAIALRNTALFTEDFGVMIERAGAGDFILLDSPYINSMGYGNLVFTKSDHIRLEAGCRKLHRCGANFLLTSSDDPWIRKLFKAFPIEVVEVVRGLGAKRRVNEIIVTNY